MSEYPDNESPWTFYFNGVAMPKWGANWGLLNIFSFIDPQEYWDWDVSPRDIWIVYCRIDHVGTVESADPDIFRYVVQEVLCILLNKREAMIENLRDSCDVTADLNKIYLGLVEAAFQMRKLTIQDGRAFWTSGYEADRLRLIETIHRASLPHGSPDYMPPPHVCSVRNQLESLWREQAKMLHKLAASGDLNEEYRQRILNVSEF